MRKEPTYLELPFGLSQRGLTAGSYFNYPGGMYGVKLAPEIKEPKAHLVVPIKDFTTPTLQDTLSTVRVILYQVALRRPVYVGCYGGFGRTGTVLAILFKALGIRDSIEYVRTVYDDHAVENAAQEKFVKSFNTGPLKLDVWRARGTAALVDFSLRFGLKNLGLPGGYEGAVISKQV